MGKEKIAIVLTRTLGDVLLVHNLIDGIYKKYEEPEVDVYVDEAYKDIVFGNPRVSKIYTSPNWLKNWEAILTMVVDKQGLWNYDDVLIPQQITQEDTIWHQLDHLRHQHLVDYYLDRCRLPAREEGEKVQLFLSEHDYAAVDRVLDINKQNKYVVVHTTSGVPTKDWDKFEELTHRLLDMGLSVFQVGATTDRPANGTVDKEDVKFFDVREKLTLSQVGALCKKALCFVGLDSGLSFVAASSGTPTIVLQGSTIPETSGPWGENVINVLSETLPQCEEIRCHTNCRFPKEVNGKCINKTKASAILDVIKGLSE